MKVCGILTTAICFGSTGALAAACRPNVSSSASMIVQSASSTPSSISSSPAASSTLTTESTSLTTESTSLTTESTSLTTESTSLTIESTTSTTTTSGPKALLTNADFDDYTDSYSPWTADVDGVSLSSVAHSSPNGLLVSLPAGSNAVYFVVSQPLTASDLVVGTPYTVSAWVRTSQVYSSGASTGCASFSIFCIGGSYTFLTTYTYAATPVDTWVQVITTCTFSAAQIAANSLTVSFRGAYCGSGDYYWDDVAISKS
ncbi:hypothetical protein G7Z17_g8235 [Cylindrodendrum hubeiense]|uniref:CBM-cenC domain-containing protein n=1 Tax=Cylindrodendrum hubeiense TaxID=595255 RepID=A0A9P5H7F9_9HYPO|nr:hypothetical protein G7Z17_g8235 [Cylindrodendrum hubeiense]